MEKKFYLPLLLASACSLPIPEGGFELPHAREAAAVVLETWGADPDRQPAIWGVLSNCSITRPDGQIGFGFTDPKSKLCKGAFYDDGGDIYLTVNAGLPYSQLLPHELAHFLWGDQKHQNRSVWDVSGKVDIGKMALLAQPKLNWSDVACTSEGCAPGPLDPQ